MIIVREVRVNWVSDKLACLRLRAPCATLRAGMSHTHPELELQLGEFQGSGSVSQMLVFMRASPSRVLVGRTIFIQQETPFLELTCTKATAREGLMPGSFISQIEKPLLLIRELGEAASASQEKHTKCVGSSTRPLSRASMTLPPLFPVE